MNRSFSSSAVLSLLIVVGTPPVAAQPVTEKPGGTIAADVGARRSVTRAGAGSIDVTAVTTTLIAFDGDGRPVLDLRPEELQVLEDGKPVPLLALEPGIAPDEIAVADEPAADRGAATRGSPPVDPEPWRVVVYVSTELAGRFVLKELCRETAAEAARLTALGDVDLVLADPFPTLITQAGRRPDDVARALALLADNVSGMTTVERIRNAFTQEFMPGVGFDRRVTLTQASPRSYATQARAAVIRERTVIRRELNRMVAWMQGQPPTARGLLVWMTGGFDLNPVDFYIPLVEQIDPSFAIPLRSEYTALSLEEDVRQVVEVALSHGWTVLPVNSTRAAFLYGADVEGAGKAQYMAGVGVSSISTQQGEFHHVAPSYPLRIIADSTGGELVTGDRQLGPALDLIRGAYLVIYQVDRPADGRLHRLEIRCRRPGVRLHGRQYAASGSLRGVAATRARRILSGEQIGGSLAMSVALSNVVRAGKGQRVADLQVSADIGELRPLLEPLGLGRMRVSVVVELGNGSTFVHHQEFDLDWDRIGDTWSFTAGIRWPKKARRAAVVVEELVSSTWGARTVELL